jgi:hypothetical protein
MGLKSAKSGQGFKFWALKSAKNGHRFDEFLASNPQNRGHQPSGASRGLFKGNMYCTQYRPTQFEFAAVRPHDRERTSFL